MFNRKKQFYLVNVNGLGKMIKLFWRLISFKKKNSNLRFLKSDLDSDIIVDVYPWTNNNCQRPNYIPKWPLKPQSFTVLTIIRKTTKEQIKPYYIGCPWNNKHELWYAYFCFKEVMLYAEYRSFAIFVYVFW